jgi:hypothetical protein
MRTIHKTQGMSGPSTVWNPETFKAVHNLVARVEQMALKLTEDQLHITREWISQILHKDLGTIMTCIEVCLSLAHEQKKYRVTTFTPTCHTSPHFVPAPLLWMSHRCFSVFPRQNIRAQNEEYNHH